MKTPGDLFTHFNPLHELLAEIALVARDLWSDGGFVWEVEFGFGLGHVAKIEREPLYKLETFDAPPPIGPYATDLAELFFEAARWRFPPGPCDTEEEEQQLGIAQHLDRAEQVLALIKSAAPDKCFLAFTKEPIFISCEIVMLLGHDYLHYRMSWAFD